MELRLRKSTQHAAGGLSAMCDLRRRMLASERGASAAEYALLMSLVAVVVMVGVIAFGISVDGLFDRSCGRVAAVNESSCP